MGSTEAATAIDDVSPAPDGIFGPYHSSLSSVANPLLPSLSLTQSIAGYDVGTPSSAHHLEMPKDPDQPALIPGLDLATGQTTFQSCADCGGRFKDGEHLERHRAQIHAPKTYSCGLVECRPFSDARSLDRHLKTAKVHRSSNTPLFSCQCGSQSPRKDHHRRHIREAKCCNTGPFRCWCGRISHQLIDHDAHYRTCSKPGSRGRGRPRKISKQEKVTE